MRIFESARYSRKRLLGQYSTRDKGNGWWLFVLWGCTGGRLLRLQNQPRCGSEWPFQRRVTALEVRLSAKCRSVFKRSGKGLGWEPKLESYCIEPKSSQRWASGRRSQLKVHMMCKCLGWLEWLWSSSLRFAGRKGMLRLASVQCCDPIRGTSE